MTVTATPHQLPRSGERPDLARALHPGAWWIWALGLAFATTRTTNPLLLLLVIGVVVLVALRRPVNTGVGLGLKLYLMLALVIIGVRVAFRVVLGADTGGTVLLTLPQLTLPDAVAGIRIGGPVTLEGVLAAVYDSLRLAGLLICIGAVNSLADPRRLLRSAPAALYEVGTTIVLALTIAPQLVDSVRRVGRARRLRGDTARGLRALRASLIPVLEDALDRSIALAASMDSRGYGRSGRSDRSTAITVPAPRTSWALLLAGVLALCTGVYGLLDPTTPTVLGGPTALLGAVLAAAGMSVAGRAVSRTVYRPDPWRMPEWLVAAGGVAAAAGVVLAGRIDPSSLHPSVQPLAWPELPLAAALGVALALLPAWTAPEVGR